MVHVHEMKLVRAVAVSSRAQKASAMVKQPTVPLAVRRKVKRRLEDLQQRGVPAVPRSKVGDATHDTGQHYNHKKTFG